MISMQVLFVVTRRFETPYYEDGTYEWVKSLTVEAKDTRDGLEYCAEQFKPDRNWKQTESPAWRGDRLWVDHTRADAHVPLLEYHCEKSRQRSLLS